MSHVCDNGTVSVKRSERRRIKLMEHDNSLHCHDIEYHGMPWPLMGILVPTSYNNVIGTVIGYDLP